MTKTYGAASGDGSVNSSGMTREQAMRRAREIADRTGEPAEVYAEPANEGDDPVAIVQPSADEITDEQVKFVVLYAWRGEQYRLLRDFDSIEVAQAAASQLKREGFDSWVESL